MNTDIIETSDETISPFDVAYPAEFLSFGMQSTLHNAQSIAERVYQQVAKEAPAVAQAWQAMKKGSRYVVDMTDSTKEAIKSGAIKLTQENGKTFAQIRDGGRYGKKIPIKEEVFRKKIDATQMANAMQMQAIQAQIQDISEQLILIDSSVREVLQGQQNDRIALYYSGLSLFLESQSITDPSLQAAIQAQALRSLCEATFQLKLVLESDVRYLANKEYNVVAKGKRKEAIETRVNNINQSFAYIHQSALLRAGIYCKMGELPAMASVLDEYSHFIRDDISANAVMIAQHDANDDGTENGTWAERAKFKLDTASIKKKLNAPATTFYIGLLQEGEAE